MSCCCVAASGEVQPTGYMQGEDFSSGANVMDEKALAKIGYDGAVKMITYEGALIWSSFRALLSANGILLAFSGAVIFGRPSEKWAVIPAAILGILAGVGWLCFS